MRISKSLSFFLLGLFFLVPVESGTLEFPEPSLPEFHSALDPISYDLQLDEYKKKCPSSDCRYEIEFIRGNLWKSSIPTKACAVFSDLAAFTGHPLYPFTLIKKAQTCSESLELVNQMTAYAKKTTDRWLAGELFGAAALMAPSLSENENLELILKAVEFSKTKSKKVQVLQKVLASKTNLGERSHQRLREELYKWAPRLQPHPPDWFAVAIDAMNNHGFTQAVENFNKVIQDKGAFPETYRASLEGLRTSYKALQKKKEALAMARKLHNWDRKHFNPRRYRDSGILLARMWWTEHQPTKALGILKETESRVGSKAGLGELHFTRGRIFEEESRFPEAISWMKASIATSTDPQLKSQHQWALTWILIKLKNYEEAIEQLKKLISTETEPGRKSQQMFWLAKSYRAMGLERFASDLWLSTIKEDPLGFYSLLSYRELGLPIPKPTEFDRSGFTKIPKKMSAGSSPEKEAMLEELIAVREFSWARQLLDEEFPLPDMATEEWQPLFIKYAKARYFSSLFGRIGKLSPAEKEKLLADSPFFLFPTPYKELVEDAGFRAGLAPEYIFSIMRQESGFDPLSISSANAYGLLQLLPSVASPPPEDPLALLDPALNIQLGAQHLRKYWDEFNGQFILATAAYNASPESVKNWVKSRFQNDPLIFIEDIPYEETRTYVKLVLRNFINYTRLSAAAPSIPFPEWCLSGIQTSKD